MTKKEILLKLIELIIEREDLKKMEDNSYIFGEGFTTDKMDKIDKINDKIKNINY